MIICNMDKKNKTKQCQFNNTWSGKILTATVSVFSCPFQTAPNLPRALISINCTGLTVSVGDGGWIARGSVVGNLLGKQNNDYAHQVYSKIIDYYLVEVCHSLTTVHPIPNYNHEGYSHNWNKCVHQGV